MSTRELIDRELAGLPEPLQREVYDFVRFLKLKSETDEFNGTLLSESALARDWSTPEEDAAYKPVSGAAIQVRYTPESGAHPASLADSGLRCPTCEYNLTGVAENRCPECGQAFDLAKLEGGLGSGAAAHPIAGDQHMPMMTSFRR